MGARLLGDLLGGMGIYSKARVVQFGCVQGCCVQCVSVCGVCRRVTFLCFLIPLSSAKTSTLLSRSIRAVLCKHLMTSWKMLRFLLLEYTFYWRSWRCFLCGGESPDLGERVMNGWGVGVTLLGAPACVCAMRAICGWASNLFCAWRGVFPLV